MRARRFDPATDGPLQPLHIRTLGGFHLEHGPPAPDASGPHLQPRPRELLLTLVSLGAADVPVERLCDALWPDADGDRAYSALCVTLRRLRAATGEAAVVLAGGRLSLAPGGCRLDYRACEELLAQAARGADDDPAAAERCALDALALLAGPYLEGEPERPEYIAARESIHGRLLRGLLDAAEALRAAGRDVASLDLVWKAQQLSPTDERVYQRLMALYQAMGRTAEGRLVYQRCQAVLRAELQTTPSAETERLLDGLVLRPARLVGVEPGAPPPGVNPPVLAVLPFEAPAQAEQVQRIGAGMAAELIDNLSSLAGLATLDGRSTHSLAASDEGLVVARRELGADYVLQGSIARREKRLCLTTRLTELASGHCQWSGRFEWPWKDRAASHHDLLRELVTELDVQLLDGEQARLWRRGTASPEAYEAFQQGRHAWNANVGHEGNREKMRCFQRALELDPGFARAVAGLAFCHHERAQHRWAADPDAEMDQAQALAERALALDPDLPEALSCLARIHLYRHRHENAADASARAAAMQPHNAEVLLQRAICLNWVDQERAAEATVRQAFRLAPRPAPYFLVPLTSILYKSGRPGEALPIARQAVSRMPAYTWARLLLVASLGALRRAREAQPHAEALRRLCPGGALTDWVPHMVRWRNAERVAALMDDLRAAGMS